MRKAREIGVAAYTAEQEEKARLLERLLAQYNSGREKTLFSLAVNLLSVEEVEAAMEEADRETAGLPVKEKARFMAGRLWENAGRHGIELKLRKKTG